MLAIFYPSLASIFVEYTSANGRDLYIVPLLIQLLCNMPSMQQEKVGAHHIDMQVVGAVVDGGNDSLDPRVFATVN